METLSKVFEDKYNKNVKDCTNEEIYHGLLSWTKERKAGRVFVCTTYGLFTDGVSKFDEYYEKGWLDRVITTNLNYRVPDLLDRPYYIEANMSKYLASIMDIINHDVSVEKVRSSNEKIMDLMKKVNEK